MQAEGEAPFASSKEEELSESEAARQGLTAQ